MNKISSLITFILIILSVLVSQIQDGIFDQDPDLKRKQNRKGLGFEFHALPTAFLMEHIDHTMSIYFPVEYNNLLIEPQISYASIKEKIDYINNIDYEQTNTDLSLLLGLFFTNQSDKSRFYVGARIGKILTEVDYSGNTSQTDETEEYIVLAPTFGIEYFISDNISFGGEGMYMMVSNERKEEEYKIITKSNALIPMFIVRFYY